MIEFTMRNSIAELSNQVDLAQDKLWMGDEDIQILLLMLDVTHGGWVTLVKAKAGAKMGTHYHTNGLYVFTVYGHWHYPEHDWQAKTGHFLYEAPGELHTPTFIEDTMLYTVIPAGPVIYVDTSGQIKVFNDVHTHLAAVREHYRKIGLTEKDVQKILR
jgi:quercetin dioxygenase-like cupin family protein